MVRSILAYPLWSYLHVCKLLLLKSPEGLHLLLPLSLEILLSLGLLLSPLLLLQLLLLSCSSGCRGSCRLFLRSLFLFTPPQSFKFLLLPALLFLVRKKSVAI